MLISLGILLLGVMIFMRVLPWTLLFVPLLLFFLLALTLGLAWFISSLGVFIRDIHYVTGFVTSALLFLSPIFFPISAVPKDFQFIMELNPLSAFMETGRRLFLWGKPPDWFWIGEVGIFSVGVLIFGYGFFMKSKRAFADVI
jgi:lipopolysaccharide transport system permease protein